MAVRGDHKGYYRELGVQRTASAEEIRQAFRERAKLVHPDQGGPEDDSRFKRLAEAYETLKDPRRRLQYDADGLAAERDRERQQQPPPPQREPEATVARRGERPHRVTAVQPSRNPWPRPVWLGALVGCAVLCCVLAALWWQARAGAASRDGQIGELARRYNELFRAEQELRARYRALGVASIDDLLAGSGGDAGGRALFSQEIMFQPGSAELDAPLEATVDRAVIDLSRALRQVPEGQDWMVVVDGYAGRAAGAEGVDVAAWETSLLRLGHVVDRLVRQGLPTDRIAARFQAGFAAALEAETSVVELKLVCCFR